MTNRIEYARFLTRGFNIRPATDRSISALSPVYYTIFTPCKHLCFIVGYGVIFDRRLFGMLPPTFGVKSRLKFKV